MMGVVVDCNFDQNCCFYVVLIFDKYYGDGCKINFECCDGNIVMCFILSEDMSSVVDRIDIVIDIQYKFLEFN